MDESDGFAAKKPKLDISFNAELSSNDGVVAKKPRLSECSNMQIVDVAVKEVIYLLYLSVIIDSLRVNSLCANTYR